MEIRHFITYSDGGVGMRKRGTPLKGGDELDDCGERYRVVRVEQPLSEERERWSAPGGAPHRWGCGSGQPTKRPSAASMIHLVHCRLWHPLQGLGLGRLRERLRRPVGC
jgi:hypothetical protein